LSFYHLLVGDDVPSVQNVVGNELIDPLHKGWTIWSHLSIVHHSINEWTMSQSRAGYYLCMSMPSQRFDMGMVEEGVFEWWKHHQCGKVLSKFKYKENNSYRQKWQATYIPSIYPYLKVYMPMGHRFFFHTRQQVDCEIG
jgi:hypothetical protein